MWRIQVLEGKHVVEAFLFDTHEEAKAQEEELQSTYLPPKYVINIEEISRPNKNKIKQFIIAIIDAFTQASN